MQRKTTMGMRSGWGMVAWGRRTLPAVDTIYDSIETSIYAL
jgi:hypothetical protein